MKLTLSTLTTIMFVCLSINALEAQRGNRNASPEERAEQQTNVMKEKLLLSAKQAEKVKDINLKYAKKIKEMRTAGKDGDRSAMQEALSVLRQEQEKELKSILTTEQAEIWAKFREHQRNEKGSRGNLEVPEEKRS